MKNWCKKIVLVIALAGFITNLNNPCDCMYHYTTQRFKGMNDVINNY